MRLGSTSAQPGPRNPLYLGRLHRSREERREGQTRPGRGGGRCAVEVNEKRLPVVRQSMPAEIGQREREPVVNATDGRPYS